jgi:hypothetical protein
MKYIKKGITSEFTRPLEKIRNHWEEFVEYKTSAKALARSKTNKGNASKKKYHHKLGPGGYKTAAPKWEKAEAALIEKGITLAMADWPLRAKQWFYAHGGSCTHLPGRLWDPMTRPAQSS